MKSLPKHNVEDLPILEAELDRRKEKHHMIEPKGMEGKIIKVSFIILSISFS
jgi:hypothetical protein